MLSTRDLHPLSGLMAAARRSLSRLLCLWTWARLIVTSRNPPFLVAKAKVQLRLRWSMSHPESDFRRPA